MPSPRSSSREAQLDADAALLLLLEPVGVGAGQRRDQRGLAVIDVAGGAEDVVADIGLDVGHGLALSVGRRRCDRWNYIPCRQGVPPPKPRGAKLVLLAPDPRTQRRELGLDALVPAIDVIDAVDLGAPSAAMPASTRAADARRSVAITGAPCSASDAEDGGVAPLEPDVGPQALQLGHVGEAVGKMVSVMKLMPAASVAPP